MRCRRSAVLSLLGWYLLSPPPRADPKSGGASGVLVDPTEKPREVNDAIERVLKATVLNSTRK